MDSPCIIAPATFSGVLGLDLFLMSEDKKKLDCLDDGAGS